MSSSTAEAEAPAITSYDDLTPEVKAIMHRAVVKSREQYWCDIFETHSPEIFGVAGNDVVDLEGFSCKGYNRQGFDKNGLDRNGFNSEGRNAAGFDKDGWDIEGFDRKGVNAEGFDRKGRDKYRYDSSGYDQEGYNHYDERRRASRDWYAVQAARPETDFVYDGNGYERPAGEKAAKQKVDLV